MIRVILKNEPHKSIQQQVSAWNSIFSGSPLFMKFKHMRNETLWESVLGVIVLSICEIFLSI